LFHEIGVWEKQSSAFFQAKSAETVLEGNLVFNLARAGFNFNDGFGGGDNITGNLLFHTCRESSDHGPINSWDRQPFITNVRTGSPSAQMEWRHVYGNLLIANYGGSKQVDNDDGSLFWRVHDNYMQYGWSQKFKCGGIESFGNYKSFVDIGGKFDVGCTTKLAPNLWHSDTMVALSTKSNFDYRQCWDSNPDKSEDWDQTRVYNNTVYLANSKLSVDLTGCESGGKSGVTITLAQAQAEGKDPGSRQINTWPTTTEILASLDAVIGSYFP
jgi:hypothetical protein